MKLKIKNGDSVVVIAGKDKGKTGLVRKVYPTEFKVIVENVNVVKCFSKKKQVSENRGKTKEMPIHLSNVMHLDLKQKKPTRVRVEIKDGKKVLVSKKSGEIIREIKSIKEKNSV